MIVCKQSCIMWCVYAGLCAYVCVCVLALLGAVTWAHQRKKWVSPTVHSGKSQAVWEAKGSCKSEAESHVDKTTARNIQPVCSIYAACYVRGWTMQRANQMCYLYGVKVRHLTRFARNPSLTLNLTFMLLHLMTCHMWSDADMFWRTRRWAWSEPFRTTDSYLNQVVKVNFVIAACAGCFAKMCEILKVTGYRMSKFDTIVLLRSEL